MAQVSAHDFRSGMKVEINQEPYVITSCEFVKPGKGQAFTRTKLKNLLTARVIDRTFKSGEKIPLADIEEKKMRFLYQDGSEALFMDDETYEQFAVSLATIQEKRRWLVEDLLYDIVFYQGNAIDLTPPTFMELEVIETAPGVRGDTASGRVMKPAKLQTGADIQVPIFIEQNERIKVDTRTGQYVSRV